MAGLLTEEGVSDWLGQPHLLSRHVAFLPPLPTPAPVLSYPPVLLAPVQGIWWSQPQDPCVLLEKGLRLSHHSSCHTQGNFPVVPSVLLLLPFLLRSCYPPLVSELG